MQESSSFNDILYAAKRAWAERVSDETVLSLALPINDVDPFAQLSCFVNEHDFCSVWDCSPGLCFAASDKCQNFDLSGPRRFELAQKFSDLTFNRLKDITPLSPDYSRARILFLFSFFEQSAERFHGLDKLPAVQCVLPRWQLSKKFSKSWLRLNAVITQESDARELVEKIWIMRNRLCNSTCQAQYSFRKNKSAILVTHDWVESYQKSLKKGIELVNSQNVEKLVLAVRNKFILEENIDLISVLSRLRKQESRSCRFLWRRNSKEAFFGASPEVLLSIKDGFLKVDALAGTSVVKQKQELFKSEKDRREHQLVVGSITTKLIEQGLKPRFSKYPKLSEYGRIVHLHTSIGASLNNQSPLQIAEVLHPTPAVAGLPLGKAISWLRALEPFERGNYASPIGWIDSDGNSEFRVAIRSAKINGRNLEITAGAGLVKGSIVEQELKEVALKLSVITDQIDSKYHPLHDSFSRTFMI